MRGERTGGRERANSMNTMINKKNATNSNKKIRRQVTNENVKDKRGKRKMEGEKWSKN